MMEQAPKPQSGSAQPAALVAFGKAIGRAPVCGAMNVNSRNALSGGQRIA